MLSRVGALGQEEHSLGAALHDEQQEAFVEFHGAWLNSRHVLYSGSSSYFRPHTLEMEIIQVSRFVLLSPVETDIDFGIDMDAGLGSGSPTGNDIDLTVDMDTIV